jgi:hypothetical protein
MTGPREPDPDQAPAEGLATERLAPRPEFAAALRERLESLEADTSLGPRPTAAAAAVYVALAAGLLALPAGGALGAGPFAP